MSASTEIAGPSAATAGGFAQSFAWGLRALVAKELRLRSRGWRSVTMLTTYLLVLAAGFAGFLALAGRSALGSSPWLGLQLFSTLALGAVLLLAFIPASLTAGAISGERERRTLDLMLVTRASTLGLVAGKLAGSVLYVLFLLVASLPAFALVYLFGGVPPVYIMLVLAVGGATAVVHASVGLVLSALLRRTVVASVAAYLVVIALAFGLPLAGTLGPAGGSDTEEARAAGAMSVIGFAGSVGWTAYASGPGEVLARPDGPPPAYTYASPLVALSSVLPTARLGTGIGWGGGVGRMSFGVSWVDVALRLVVGGRQPVGSPDEKLLRAVYLEQDRTTGELGTREVWAPWVYYVAGSLAVAPLAVLLAAAVVTPRRLSWRMGWRRRG